MGTIVCKECEQTISPIESEKSEVIFGICDKCQSGKHSK